jgi:hypothetical protein
MAYEEALHGISLNAGADLSAASNLYNVVKVTSAGAVKTTVLGEAAIGILQSCEASGKPVKVGISGVSKAKAGGTIAAGAQVTASAAGLVVAAATGNKVLGVALTAAVANDVIPVLLAPAGVAAFA